MNSPKVAWIAATLALCACGSSTKTAVEEEDAPAIFAASADSEFGLEDQQETEFDEDAARADAEQEVADDGYSGPCTIDCSGHDAGFTWAADGHEDRGISNSRSFDEGQEAYDEAVEERLEEKRQEFEDEGPDSEYSL